MKTLILLLAITALSTTVFGTNPVVSNVVIYGEALYNGSATSVGAYSEGTILTGSYKFTDADDDTDVSSYNWYIDTDNDGLWNDEVSVGTDIRYTVPNPSTAPAIFFVVSPEDSNAETAADSESASMQPASTSYDNSGSSTIALSGVTQDKLNVVLDNNKNISLSSGAFLTIHGDLESNNGSDIIVRDGTTLIVKGQLITNNNVIITVEEGGVFNVESGLQAKNNAVITISGVVNITGDVDVKNTTSFTVEGTGIVAVSGNVNFGPGNNNTLHVDGTMTIGGDITGNVTLSGLGSLSIDGIIAPSVIDQTGGVLLPIELVYFNLQREDNKVNINWQTATELNNDYFTIERSHNGYDYESIGTMLGAGNSSNQISYTFTDNDPINGISYYRLMQTDYNGDYEIFNPASISFEQSSYFLLEQNVSIYPNPIQSGNDVLKIDIEGEFNSEIVMVRIFTTSGQQVLVKELILDGFSASKTVSVSSLSRGTYFVIVKTAQNNFPNKLIIQ